MQSPIHPQVSGLRGLKRSELSRLPKWGIKRPAKHLHPRRRGRRRAIVPVSLFVELLAGDRAYACERAARRAAVHAVPVACARDGPERKQSALVNLAALVEKEQMDGQSLRSALVTRRLLARVREVETPRHRPGGHESAPRLRGAVGDGCYRIACWRPVQPG